MRKALENSPHNKKLLDQQNLNQEESRKESSKKEFNQILFSSAPREVEESRKIENPTSEINKVQKNRK